MTDAHQSNLTNFDTCCLGSVIIFANCGPAAGGGALADLLSSQNNPLTTGGKCQQVAIYGSLIITPDLMTGVTLTQSPAGHCLSEITQDLARTDCT